MKHILSLDKKQGSFNQYTANKAVKQERLCEFAQTALILAQLSKATLTEFKRKYAIKAELHKLGHVVDAGVGHLPALNLGILGGQHAVDQASALVERYAAN